MTTKEEFLVFDMLGIAYAVSLGRVREIMTYSGAITKLPSTAEWVLGVINLRGEITPVVDFRRKFSKIRQLYDEETIVIALRFADDRMIAIVVDSIEGTAEIAIKEIQPAPDIGSAIEPRYLKGLIEINNDMVSILDIDALLDLREI